MEDSNKNSGLQTGNNNWNAHDGQGQNLTGEPQNTPGEEVKTSVPMKKDPLVWEEVKTEHIIQDEWIDFRKIAYRFPDGNIYEPFYAYSRRDYVVIVASDTDGNYLCVRQFRHGIKQVTTEFPAGGIERFDGKDYSIRSNDTGNGRKDGTSIKSDDSVDGDSMRTDSAWEHAGEITNAMETDSLAENALDAARRELLEETGYESDEWKHLLTVPSNATIADNYAYLFVAKNCRKVSGQELDETEFVNVVKLSGREIEEMISKGEFQQAMHITAWLLASKNR